MITDPVIVIVAFAIRVDVVGSGVTATTVVVLLGSIEDRVVDSFWGLEVEPQAGQFVVGTYSEVVLLQDELGIAAGVAM